jgi:dipeptidyl aminopeptidase/acylaminoacyl peptidase
MKSALWLALACGVCAAQTSPEPLAGVLKELAAVHGFEEAAISPDGTRLAWVEQAGGSVLYVRDWRARGKPVRVAAPAHSIAWSPDSRRFAFLCDRGRTGQMQLCVARASGGGFRKLTSVKGYLADPAWSPAGKQVAILFAENAPEGGGPLQAVPPQTGVIGGEIHNQRLSIVDAASGALRQVSPADLNVYEYDWSPDGRTFALTAAPGPADDNWFIAQLYTMPAATGRMTAIYKPRWQIAVPRWSPDGARIGFIEGLMSDEGFTGGDVFTIPASGGAASNRTPGRKSSVSWIRWLSPARLLLTEIVGGGSAISTLDLPGGASERLWEGAEDLHAGGNFPNLSVARDGRTAAAIRSDWQHAPEIWAGTIGQWQPVTHVNDALKPQWGKAQSLEWTNQGFTSQGWLIYPRDYDARRQYPMVVEVHGGPASVKRPRWPTANFDMTVLSALGYFVLFPNPRGSYGQGEAFTRANIQDFGGGDFRDILAGVSAAEKQAPADDHRVGITGWSYGGYMSMWAVTQTQRFRAAVAGAGLANWQSYYGENSIDQWMIPYFGASVYADPKVYAKSSPITFIQKAKTPTLVLVGERDGECPAPQSYEFWHALKTLGVPTELVVYPGEGHMFLDPAHKRDALERAVDWFGRYMR